MLSAFNTGAGGVTSSEILPKRSQSYKITEQQNEETKINQVRISLGFKNMQKDLKERFQHQFLAILKDK
jgi:hypothetical protein